MWFCIYWVRFYAFPEAQTGLQWEFLRAGLLLGVLTLYFFSREGLYLSQRLRSRYEEVLRVFKANCYVNITFVVVLYFVAEARLSRFVLLAYFVSSTMAFVFVKLSVRSALRVLRRQGRNLRYVLLVGHGEIIEKYIHNIQSFRESGIEFVGWVDSQERAAHFGIKSLNLEQGMELRAKIDSIVIGYQGEYAANVDKVLRTIYNDVVPIVVLPDLTYSLVGYQIEHMAGVPALVVNQPNFSSVDIVAKRIFDIMASGLGLIALSPFFFILSVIIKITSPGPIFFGQERIGLDGLKFKIWKFRSMKVGSHIGTQAPGWTVENDPRRTKIGTFIRATSIDELPQLWNVFVGDMSLVGPRPEQPYYVEKFRHEIPAYMLRHKMKAGITGWAQVNGWRGNTSLHKRIECDLYYIRNWSLWLDIKILFMTLWRGALNKNAY